MASKTTKTVVVDFIENSTKLNLSVVTVREGLGKKEVYTNVNYQVDPRSKLRKVQQLCKRYQTRLVRDNTLEEE